MAKKIAIIGSGFASLSAAAYLAKAGHEVSVYEKNGSVGGRASQLKREGFTFDMGPSWYWMPDIFEKFFGDFGKKVSDYYQLDKLDPAYKIFFSDEVITIGDSMDKICAEFERIEPGSAVQLRKLIEKAGKNYDIAINKVVLRPGLSPLELITPETALRVDQFFKTISGEVRKKFKNPKLISTLEFPVLFLGAKPSKTPAFYNFMNFADFGLGTWHPKGGMYEIIKAMKALVESLGVRIHTRSPVEKIIIEDGKAVGLQVLDECGGGKGSNADGKLNSDAHATIKRNTLTEGSANAQKKTDTDVIRNSDTQVDIEGSTDANGSTDTNGNTEENGSLKSPLSGSIRIAADMVLSGADYHHSESLLRPEHRQYSEAYWAGRTFAPSSLLFYIGFDKKLKNVEHHNLFFDTDFARHASEIYDDPKWPQDPLFYANFPSVTDRGMAPESCEAGFFLVPIAPGLSDTPELRSQYFDLIMTRFESRTGQRVRNSIIFKESFCVNDFVERYNSYKGNAYGLANTLSQTAFLRPNLKSAKVANLFFAGQLTVPGPGVPPALISGKLASDLILKNL